MRVFPAVAFGCSLLVLGASACSTSAEEATASDNAITNGHAVSEIGRQVVSVLETKHPGARGRTWDVSSDNTLDPGNAGPAGWLLQTPPSSFLATLASAYPIAAPCAPGGTCDRDYLTLACRQDTDCTGGGFCTPVKSTVRRPGEAPRSLCVGHSDGMYDAMYEVIRNAESFVDISTLSPFDGRFEAALRNAVTYLSNTGRSVRVRFLYGDIIGNTIVVDRRQPHDLLTSLTRDAKPGGVRVSVATYRDGVDSWNHAKIVAADGKVAIAGGHNMWSQHYLQQNPVSDMSMRLRGGAAAQASHFLNELWDFTCKGGSTIGKAIVADFPQGAAGCAEPFRLTPPPGPGSTSVISVGRLGSVGDDAADDAILAMLRAAKRSLKISIQDLGPPSLGPDALARWPDPYLKELALAAARGVDVQLVLSNKGAVVGGLNAAMASYANGWTLEDVLDQITSYAKNHTEVLQGADPSVLCRRISIAGLRRGFDDVWPDGAVFGNHAKLAIADDRIFYIGSQNWYTSDLAEFGFIVDDEARTRELLDAYFTPIWKSSSRSAISGPKVCP